MSKDTLPIMKHAQEAAKLANRDQREVLGESEAEWDEILDNAQKEIYSNLGIHEEEKVEVEGIRKTVAYAIKGGLERAIHIITIELGKLDRGEIKTLDLTAAIREEMEKLTTNGE